MKKIYKRLCKWFGSIVIAAFILLNVLAAIQAYCSTHFDNNKESLPPQAENSAGALHSIIPNIPRPRTNIEPNRLFEYAKIKNGEDKYLSAWIMRVPIDSVSKGLVILCHGYTDEKSMLLDYAYRFLEMGYDTMLPDFMGAGDSYGSQTTIGYLEAANVKTFYDYATHQLEEKNVYLLGFSMGAAAILKAQHDYNMPVKGIIAESSYGRLINTMKARMGKPAFWKTPVAHLIAFWAGLINEVNVWNMNPIEYAKAIQVPTLIACGEKDTTIPREDTQSIYNNLASTQKMLKFYPESEHEMFTLKHPDEWERTIREFLNLTEKYPQAD
jgi:alpha-beta hydrolase superfamily lysophospholipase